MDMVTIRATAVAPPLTTLRYVRWFVDVAKQDRIFATLRVRGYAVGTVAQVLAP